ncbi:T-cell surface glycoprotein CD1a-like [Carassius gibelio]|uniref:T-cell surface glycoprotein CD1a-like n=1 Tax=Carassius gibelio TaxID=101364 RepID=UPI002277F2DF|nr:T-cell surface glycoprotein CD1a-like [Carassius gibelio]
METRSHTLMGLATYITGEGAFCASLMLDDITVGYYNSVTKIYVARGNDTNEDDVIAPNYLKIVSYEVHQVMGLCEQSDNKHGHIISKTAYRGSAFDERFFDGNFTYQVFSNYTQSEVNHKLELSKQLHEKVYYPACIKTLKNYLKKRETQLSRKVKPRARLLQKANSDSGGSRVSCLATGFYPRHINLTLFRDGQPVSDHEITGGDLLPNDDGTYQMRKSLEIRAEDKHTYTCSVTHLSLDNKLDVTLELEHGEPFKSVIPSVLTVLALVLVSGASTAVKRIGTS